MSANVESMFYVSNDANQRFVPWHGMGVSVSNCLTSKEAIIAAGLDWEVNRNPIYDMNGKEIPNYKANTRSSDGSILGIVSDKYKIVQNIDAFEFTDSLVADKNNNVEYEVAGSLRDGKSVWMLAKLPPQIIVGDQVDPYVCFTNAHDGTGAIKVCMTPVRVVCANTLNFALKTAKRTWSTRHMGDIFSKLAEAKHTLGLANEYMAALSKNANDLAKEKFTRDEFIKVIDAMYPVDYANDSKRKIDNTEYIKAALLNCYNAADLNNFRNTKYGAMMAVTDMVAHTSPNRMTSKWSENTWGKIMTGHPVVDEFYNRIAA